MQTGHETVTGSRSETTRQVKRTADTDERDRSHHVAGLHPIVVRYGNRGRRDIEHVSDDDEIRDGANARALAQRPPREQHHATDGGRRPAKRDVRVARDSLGEHRPGRRPPMRDDQQAFAAPEHRKTEYQGQDHAWPEIPSVLGPPRGHRNLVAELYHPVNASSRSYSRRVRGVIDTPQRPAGWP